jgi:hypothetical protein
MRRKMATARAARGQASIQGVIVFLESDIEDLVRRLDAPVATSDEQPMVSGEAHAGHA